jgi:hypothetical protein
MLTYFMVWLPLAFFWPSFGTCALVCLQPGGPYSPDPPWLASVGALLPVGLAERCCYGASEGSISLEDQSSIFLGDPPPDPRFLASLGALSLVGLAKSATERLREAFPRRISHRQA